MRTFKHYFFPIIMSLILAGCHFGPKKSDNATVVKQLKDLLAKDEYFKLDALFKLIGDQMDEGNRLYFKAYISNAFNRNEACVKAVDSVFSSSLKLTDSDKVALRQLQGDSYFKLFEYEGAAQCDSDILKHYTHAISKETIVDVKNDLLIRAALSKTPKQESVIKNNTTIAWTKDALGLIEIPVTTNAHLFKAIFDTRANISSITQTYAKKLGLRMLSVSYNETGGATGIQFKTGMGIADSLYIGNILLKNVVFQVMPDPMLYIAPVKFQLNIIIGFPVIEQLHEVHIFNNGKMTIPLVTTKSDLHNFVLNGLDPVIALKSGNDTLAFNFDSGASSSNFYASYFKKYKATILKNGIKKTVGFGGAGGSQKKEVYVLPKTDLTIGNATVAVDSISVMMEKITPDEKFYGNIGQDFTKNFSEMIYNFKDMYIKGIK
ncbi:MAG: putative aspartyl protease [Mucilaginibacter sp.]|nr:putative aspartyl protease [Mucilaginibacter sp.]